MNTTPTLKNGSPAASKAAARPRMSLNDIIDATENSAVRVLAYGEAGLGKTTFAKDAPAPIFIGKKADWDDQKAFTFKRFKEPTCWEEVLDAIQVLQTNDTPYKTLVIDHMTWLEPLCWEKTCRNNGWSTIEEPGFGKGYDAALDEWRILLARLERLWESKQFNIVLLAHSVVKSFNDPEGPSFDRHQLSMNQKAAGLLKAWCSAVLFGKYETSTYKDKSKRTRVQWDGARLLHTQWNPAYDAKNRHNLPESLPMAWDDFAAAVEAGRDEGDDQRARADEIRGRIEALLTTYGDDAYGMKARKYVADSGDDIGKLSVIENKIAARLQGKQQPEPTKGE
jgi:hypothetical protein